ncbi:MAG: hypothetical protein WBK55_03870 [Alphaproteobacteria bacterium]
MAFGKVVAGGVGVIFLVAAVGGGITKCTFAENPEEKSIPEKFTHHTIETGEKMATETGKWLKKKAEDPEVQQTIQNTTETAVDFAIGASKSIMGGITQALRRNNGSADDPIGYEPNP